MGSSKRLSSRDRFRSYDLWVMSPPRWPLRHSASNYFQRCFLHAQLKKACATAGNRTRVEPLGGVHHGDHDLHVLGSTYMFWEKHDLHVYGGKLTCLWIFRLTHLQAKKFFLHKKNFSSEKARSKKKFFFLPVKNFLWRPLAKFLCLCAKCFTLSPWGRILMVFTHIT